MVSLSITSPGKKQMCFLSMCLPNVIWSSVNLMWRVSMMSHSRARGWFLRADSRRGIWLWNDLQTWNFYLKQCLILPWLFGIGPTFGFAVFEKWCSVLRHRVHWVYGRPASRLRSPCSSCTGGSWSGSRRAAPPGRSDDRRCRLLTSLLQWVTIYLLVTASSAQCSPLLATHLVSAPGPACACSSQSPFLAQWVLVCGLMAAPELRWASCVNQTLRPHSAHKSLH